MLQYMLQYILAKLEEDTNKDAMNPSMGTGILTKIPHLFRGCV